MHSGEGQIQNEEEQRSAFLLVLRDSEKHTADRTEASRSSGKSTGCPAQKKRQSTLPEVSLLLRLVQAAQFLTCFRKQLHAFQDVGVLGWTYKEQSHYI